MVVTTTSPLTWCVSEYVADCFSLFHSVTIITLKQLLLMFLFISFSDNCNNSIYVAGFGGAMDNF